MRGGGWGVGGVGGWGGGWVVCRQGTTTRKGLTKESLRVSEPRGVGDAHQADHWLGLSSSFGLGSAHREEKGAVFPTP